MSFSLHEHVQVNVRMITLNRRRHGSLMLSTLNLGSSGLGQPSLSAFLHPGAQMRDNPLVASYPETEGGVGGGGGNTSLGIRVKLQSVKDTLLRRADPNRGDLEATNTFGRLTEKLQIKRSFS